MRDLVPLLYAKLPEDVGTLLAGTVHTVNAISVAIAAVRTAATTAVLKGAADALASRVSTSFLAAIVVGCVPCLSHAP